MKKNCLLKALFFGVTGLLLIPYLVYALAMASVSVNIYSEVNGASSSHAWNTDNPDFDHTDCWLVGYDLTAGGQKLDEKAFTSFSASGTKTLSIGWNPIVGHTYKAKASTYVISNVGTTIASASDEDTKTK